MLEKHSLALLPEPFISIIMSAFSVKQSLHEALFQGV